MTVLDVGCGPGSITIEIAEQVAPGLVTGVDRSASALLEAHVAAQDKHVDNVDFTVGDALSLPFPSNTFDVAHAHHVLHHVSDPVLALREMERVVRPGGWIATRDVDLAGVVASPRPDGLEDWRRREHAAIARQRADDQAAARYRRWAREARLDDVRIGSSLRTYSDRSSRTWWAQRVSRVFDNLAMEAAQTGGTGGDTDWLEWAVRDDAQFSVLHVELLAPVK
jgi:ubiquinone/menaquinone biosynthesis C-methylase UbiE